MLPRSSEEKVELGFNARKITPFGCTVVSITTRARSEKLAGFGLGRDR